jgi:hypothetical protein
MDVKVKCPYCKHINLIDIENYGLDFSQLDYSGTFENLYDRCSGCQEAYSFDAHLKFTTSAFKDENIPH